MKALFDILLVAGMLGVMVMLLLGVNQLASPTDSMGAEEETKALKEDFDCGTGKISRRGIFGSFLMKKVTVENKDSQNMISNGPSSRKL